MTIREARRLGGQRRASNPGERGASMVEAAIVTPVFVLLIFGVFEFGFLLRDYLTVTNTVTESTRAASVYGRDPDADFLILQSLSRGLTQVGLEHVEGIVIFKATGPDDQVPPSCLNADVVDLCNHYTRNDLFLPLIDETTGEHAGAFGCSTGASDVAWCPLDRETALDPGPDYIGVHIAVSHDYLTGFFGDHRKIEHQQIIRIEPERNR